MGIKTVPQLPCSPELSPCEFCLFPKLRGCRYETIGEMKEAVTKFFDTLTQEDFYGALLKLLERYNKCIAARGDYFEGDKSLICELSIKMPIRKKFGNLSYAGRNYLFFKRNSKMNSTDQWRAFKSPKQKVNRLSKTLGFVGAWNHLRKWHPKLTLT